MACGSTASRCRSRPTPSSTCCALNGWRTAPDRQEPPAEFQRRATVRRSDRTLPAGYVAPPEGLRRGRQGRPRRPDLRPGKRQDLRRQSRARPASGPITASTMSSCARSMPPACRATIRNGCASAAPTATSCADRRTSLPHDYVLPQAWRTALPEELYPTSYVIERTLAYLDDHARDGRRQAVLPAMLVSRSASSVHAARPLLGHVQARGHGAAGRIPHRQPAAAAARRRAACRARQRHPRRQLAAGLCRQRARDPRGDRADLRHDRDDRRRHREDPRSASTSSG